MLLKHFFEQTTLSRSIFFGVVETTPGSFLSWFCLRFMQSVLQNLFEDLAMDWIRSIMNQQTEHLLSSMTESHDLELQVAEVNFFGVAMSLCRLASHGSPYAKSSDRGWIVVKVEASQTCLKQRCKGRLIRNRQFRTTSPGNSN